MTAAPETPPKGQRPAASGPLRTRIVSVINAGKASTLDDLRPIVKDLATGVTLERAVARMLSDGLLVAKRGGAYGITGRALRFLSVAPAPFRAGVYVLPATPPRRPGSMDFAEAPSLAAGVRRPWRHPV